MASSLPSPFGLVKRLRVRSNWQYNNTTRPTSIAQQARTVYQSRQPWHGNPSVALEHMRDESVDFDDFMKEAAAE
jgi:small subunit ribosomal protein S10